MGKPQYPSPSDCHQTSTTSVSHLHLVRIVSCYAPWAETYILFITTEQCVDTLKEMNTNHQKVINFLRIEHLANTRPMSELISWQPHA